MIRGASLVWRLLPVAGLTLLATATLLSHLLPPTAPASTEAYVLKISAPVVTALSPPGPFPPAMGEERLLTAALAAAGWSALCLSLPPLLLRPLLGRTSLLFALPGAAFVLFTLFCFVYMPDAAPGEAPRDAEGGWLLRAPQPAGSLPDLLSQLFALNLLLVCDAALIGGATRLVRCLKRPPERGHPPHDAEGGTPSGPAAAETLESRSRNEDRT